MQQLNIINFQNLENNSSIKLVLSVLKKNPLPTGIEKDFSKSKVMHFVTFKIYFKSFF